MFSTAVGPGACSASATRVLHETAVAEQTSAECNVSLSLAASCLHLSRRASSPSFK